MLKKMLAITLAAVMAIMPMTASAVTWGEVVNGLNAKLQEGKDHYYYDEDEDVGIGYSDEFGVVNVYGTGTITGDVILITPDTVSGAYEYYFNDVKLDADQIKVEANDQYVSVGFSEETVVNGDVVGESKGEYGYVYFGNSGTINGDMTVTGAGSNYNDGTVGNMTVTVIGEEAYGYNENYGTVGNMTVTITGEESYGRNYNEGTAGDMTATVTGEASCAENDNSGTAANMNAAVIGEGFYADNYNHGVVTGDMNSTAASEGSNNWNENYGEVGGDMNATATGKDSYIYNYVSGGVVGGSMNAEANAEGAAVQNSVYNGYDDETGEKIASDVSNVTATASNGGIVANEIDTELDSMTAVIGEDGEVIAGYMEWEYDEETETETSKQVVDPEAVNAKNVTIVIEASAEDTYTAEQIKAMIEATGMTPTETIYYTVNADGERTAQYSIGADGSLTFVRKLIEEYTAEELEWIKKQDKIARENHERELKRHAEAIGGVTASPEWVKQLFLGYMSLNLRMYENGEQILFREKLAWAGDGTKNLTLRVNIEEPQALTVRLDEVVLDKLEQAEISLITLLAKDGTPVMQYKVSDLRGAYTQYGLAGADLLVVGGADDEVMKIGADGEMKPVEAE